MECGVRVGARDGAKGMGACTWRCMQAVEGVNEQWRVVLLSVFSFFFGRMRTGSNCVYVRAYAGQRQERVGANKLRGVVSAVNSSNGQYLPFIPFFGWVRMKMKSLLFFPNKIWDL